MTVSEQDRTARIVATARDLISNWMGLLRAVRLYDSNNEAIRTQLERILAGIHELSQDSGQHELAVIQDAIYVGGQRVREGTVGSAGYHALIDLMRGSGIGGFQVDRQVTPEEVEAFARVLGDSPAGSRTLEELNTALLERGITRISLTPWREDQLVQSASAPRNSEEVAKRIYMRSVGTVKEVFQKVQKDGQIHARRVKRVVQQMLQNMDDDPAYMMNLSSLKNYDEYTFNHSVNVSVLAIALGRRIELPKSQLYALGQAGMLHDLGKLCVDKDVLNKPGALTPDERMAIQMHPVEGFVTIASKMGVSDETIRVALGAYEHHLNEDGTGYPQFATCRATGMLSRIVAIADRYDAMTSARVYRREPIPPSKALSIMFHSQRTQHDQTLLRYFMNMMGYYPLGTVIRLSEGSIGVVVGAAPDNELRHYPKVKILLDPDGRAGSKEVIDLAARAKDPEPIRIEEALDADRYGIQAMDHLL